MTRLTRRTALGTAMASTLLSRAHAQAYPNRPIRLVVPYPAGGPTDLGATVQPLAPPAFDAMIRAETTKWAAVVAKTGAHIE